ncbi:RNase H-like domain found in reverse transcriptase [Popillia japonica]|uniref:RNase H-like domain found in reverse transcriptase n=1 Tax=Popillia japonica TaxID=7064 RepID=A0AAW1KNB9_POPJA
MALVCKPSIDNLKQKLSEITELTYYDPSQMTHLHLDVGPKGLGTVISQGSPNTVVAYGSKSLTKCEERYSQIEKEMLAIAWAGKRFTIQAIKPNEYSRYPIVDITPSTNFRLLKTILENTFTTFGIPGQLKSDNGPPFNSQEFTAFLRYYGIRHHKVTPYWPQANGMVERFVKTVNRSLICANLETSKFNSQLNEFLLNFRSTPHSTTTKSPYELLFGRKMRNYVPTQETDNKEQLGEERREKNNEYANERIKTNRKHFIIGKKVLCNETH